MPYPLIAIVGRPNVGKSTLFNRLIGQRRAVVSPSRGTTRDRLYGVTEWRGVPFTLIDTGGVDDAVRDGLAETVQDHIRRAREEADALLLLCDAGEGLVPADEMILAGLRKTGKPIVLVVNKLDHRLAVPPDFFSLGISHPVAISALHGRGIGELLDELIRRMPADRPSPPAVVPQEPVTLAVIGRQNVGKSSLVNALLREDRVIVHDQPGTTRDAVETFLTVQGQPVRLIDTAGLRHRRKVKHPVDLFSMSRTHEAIERCEVALVVLDATQGITQDDRRIVAAVGNAGRGLILLVNKWDLVRGVDRRQLEASLRRALPAASFTPILAVSAKTGFQVPRILPQALTVVRAMRRAWSDETCRTLLQGAWEAKSPPRFRGRTVRLHEARWVPGRPVRLELVTRPVGRLPEPYLHYLRNVVSADPRWLGVPIRLVVQDSRARRAPRPSPPAVRETRVA